VVVAPLVNIFGWGEVAEAALVALAVAEDLDELEEVDECFGRVGNQIDRRI